jgi:hypothetical protein
MDTHDDTPGFRTGICHRIRELLPVRPLSLVHIPVTVCRIKSHLSCEKAPRAETEGSTSVGDSENVRGGRRCKQSVQVDWR